MTLLQTTDIHDHARDAGVEGAGLGSYARVAAYVEFVRASAGHPVVLVDSGDWSMGTLYDLTLGRQPLALWFADALRYDCITLGNHEFDYGPAGLAGILAAARQGFTFRTPIVASNLELNGDPHLAPFLGARKPIRHTLVETLPNGLRVGFLGLMGRDASSVAPAAAPVRFTDYSRNAGLVQGLVDDLRANQHCQIVIALDHAGTDATGAEGEDVDLARRVRGIDVIASGHMHNPLASARTVANGGWNTLICCAGAFGTNVSRLDLVYRASPGATSLEAFENRPMTDASLAALGPGVAADPALGWVVAEADRGLNRGLAQVFAQLPRPEDYDPADPARGIYRPLGACAQDLRSNDGSAVPAPNGLGDFCADAFRAAANGLLASIPPPPGTDPAPFTAAVAATGELRGALDAGAAITFSDLYSVMPLGLSPDPGQAGATGEPLVSGYMDPGGVRALCALQLLAQAGLTTSDFYLNLSGLSYELKAGEADTFFAMARAAAVISVTRRKAGAGSVQAGAALEALAALGSDRGGALLALVAGGNPYAGAMVPRGDPSRITASLGLLGQVAQAAALDAASGSTELDALLMARAVAAIGTVSAFSPLDQACTGSTEPLGPGRCRVAVDLYVLLMIHEVQSRFGTQAAIYPAAQGDTGLSAAAPGGLQRILDNRINLDPGGPLRELKVWTALLLYLTTPPSQGGHFAGGWISPEYFSSADFRQFPSFGAGVRTRNAGYPLDRLSSLAATVQALAEAP
jgi:2',3'-cyclic-nucleotide 2'-phosphodiesterase (5'-nucleotidase family)